MARAYNPNTKKAQGGRSMQICSHPGLYGKMRQVWAIQQDTVSNKTKNEAKKQNKIPKKLTINTQNDTNTQAHTDVCTHTNTHIYTNTHKHINAHKYKHMCTHTLKEALFL